MKAQVLVKRPRGRPRKIPLVVVEPPKPKSNAGRKSLLRLHVWESIYRKRLFSGFSLTRLAKDHGLSVSSIFEAISENEKIIRSASSEIIQAEKRIMALPITARVVANDFLSNMRASALNLSETASNGASTAARVSRMANKKTELLDDTAPYAVNRPILQEIAEMTALANEAAKVPMALLSSNKEQAAEASRQEKEINPRMEILTHEAATEDYTSFLG